MKKSWVFLSVIVILGLSACAGIGRQSEEQEGSDAVITEQVQSALFFEPSLSTAQINVRTVNGVVRLTGAVERSTHIGKATEVASSIPGVVEVRNMLVAKE